MSSWRKVRHWFVVVVLLAVAVGGAYTGRGVSAQGNPQSGGVTVTPAKLQLTLSPGRPSVSSPVTLRNNTGLPARFKTSFKNVNLSPRGALVPAGDLSSNLSGNLKVDQTEFVIEPGAIMLLTVTATDSSELSPGGQYASLFIEQTADDTQSLAITPAVSVGLFILKEDGAVRDLRLNGLTHSGNLFSLPSSVTASFAADGNVAVVPKASVSLVSPRGKLVAAGIINQESLILQPKGSLRLEAPLLKQYATWWPGKYKIQVVYRYEGSDQQFEATTTFWHLPPMTLLIMSGLLVAAVAAARYLWRFIPLPKPRRVNRANFAKHPKPTRPTKIIDVVAPAARKNKQD